MLKLYLHYTKDILGWRPLQLFKSKEECKHLSTVIELEVCKEYYNSPSLTVKYDKAGFSGLCLPEHGCKTKDIAIV